MHEQVRVLAQRESSQNANTVTSPGRAARQHAIPETTTTRTIASFEAVADPCRPDGVRER